MLLVKRPISICEMHLKVKWCDVFKKLGKAIVAIAGGKYVDLGHESIELGDALGLSRDPGDVAWLLIRRALTRALAALVDAHRDLFSSDPPDKVALASAEEALGLESEVMEIGYDFFDSPGSLDLIGHLHAPLAKWLTAYGVAKPASLAIATRLRPYFVSALHDEWARAPGDYLQLREAVDSPFVRADGLERAWLSYEAHLRRLVNEPMFAEAFGLETVYVAPRAYWEERERTGRGCNGLGHPGCHQSGICTVRCHVVDLTEELCGWLADNRREDAMRVLSGGPGSGKSSFARMFAAATLSSGQVRVLYLPLHLVDPKGDLVKSVGEYLRGSRLLPINPLEMEPALRPSRLLLIFDGLDELAMQGRDAAATSRAFIQEVDISLQRLNMGEPWISALVSGRELVVQSNAMLFRRPRQILHMLAYAMPEAGHDVGEEYSGNCVPEDIAWEDPKDLRLRDQRADWWKKYSSASGIGIPTLPDAFVHGDLGDITRQPLILYLVALGFGGRGRVPGSETDLNGIYEELINAVWERGWEKGRLMPGTQPLSQADFLRVLQEIALVAWQDNRRTTTARAIRARMRAVGLGVLIDGFEHGAESGVTRLLTAFYFRQFGEQDGERTFEFTHRSFGEYLVAGRIVRTLTLLDRNLRAREKSVDEGKDVFDVLESWAEACGPASLDDYHIRFLNREIARAGAERATDWQQTLSQMITAAAVSGSPIERIRPRPATFREELRQARNADEAMLVVAAACGDVTNQLTKVKWPSSTSAGEWLRRLQGQHPAEANRILQRALRHLDLTGSLLAGADLYRANMRSVVLAESQLFFAWMMDSDLESSVLDGCALDGANLRGANLAFASLRGASGAGMDLRTAELRGAILEDAELNGAELGGANLEEARLARARLQNAVLRGTVLLRADLRETDLRGADLRGADLHGADLHGAKVRGALIDGARIDEGAIECADSES